MSDDDIGGKTLQEHEILQQLKVAAGLDDYDDNDAQGQDMSEGARWSDDHVQTSDRFRNVDLSGNKQFAKSKRLSVKELADQMILVSEEPLEQKSYAKLLLPNERVVYDSAVWKRAGLSFKNRILILTNKPRLFYTTLQGHFKGLVPWSMLEPIVVTKVDDTRFDISVHSSSRIYHFNDTKKGSDKWIALITELSECWKDYLENR